MKKSHKRFFHPLLKANRLIFKQVKKSSIAIAIEPPLVLWIEMIEYSGDPLLGGRVKVRG